MKGHTSLHYADQKRIPDNQMLLAAIAQDQQFQLYQHYGETQAAKIIGIHPATLKKMRLNGHISFVRIGKRRVALFGYQIAQYLINQIQSCPDINNENFNLATIGSANAADRLHITEPGLTKLIDGRTASLSLQRTLRKPKHG